VPLLFGVLLSRSPADAWLSPASALPTSAETAICTLLLLHEELLTVFFCRPIAAASVENAEHVVRVGNRGIYSFHPSGLRKRAFDITRPPSCCSHSSGSGRLREQGSRGLLFTMDGAAATVSIVTGSFQAAEGRTSNAGCGEFRRSVDVCFWTGCGEGPLLNCHKEEATNISAVLAIRHLRNQNISVVFL
jgi:hypothetical protein